MINLRYQESRRRLAQCLPLLSLVFLVVVSVGWAQSDAYSEAPALAAQVAAGELPPVEERLPENPLVIPVVERIGEYGGEWRSGMLGPSDQHSVTRTILYEPLVRWDPEWTGVVPNLAESWEFNEDGSEFTFHLREGVKWSDGTLFTSADILFWFEDIINNEELSPGGQPSWLRVQGQDATMSAPDPYTIVFSFAGPNGLFLQRLATFDGLAMVNVQAEYARQWHIDYNEQANELASQEDLPSWVELFQSRINARLQNPDLPTLTGWRLVTPLGTGQRVVFERNPFYWKVDEAGNQLPYIDRVIYPIIEDREVLLLNVMSGEVDMISRHVPTTENRSVLFDHMEQGDYQFYDAILAFANTTAIFLNLTHPDPVLREIFNNKLFRQALSVGINRQEIIDVLYVGQGEPHQAAPRPESEFYDETFAKQFTEYDPEQAAAWLDEAGYTMGPDGRRLGPDGEPIVFAIDASTGQGTGADALEMIVDYWRELGLDVNFRILERSLFDLRRDNNEHDAQVFVGVGGLDVVLRPSLYFPFDGESRQAVAWRYWFNNPDDARAEEPPAEIRRQMELYRQLQANPDPAVQAELMQEILEIAQEGFYVMGISLEPASYGIVKNNFHNVPDTMFEAWTLLSPAQTAPEQYFIEGSAR